jgi:hypothetical protein
LVNRQVSKLKISQVINKSSKQENKNWVKKELKQTTELVTN